MVLGPHREPLVIGAEARPLGHGPAFENAVQFQTKIIVQATGSVLLHDEPVAGALCDLASGLAGFVKVALEIIIGKRIRFLCHGYPVLRDLPLDDFLSEPLSVSTDFFSAAIKSITLPPGDAPSSTSSSIFLPPDFRLLAINCFRASI